MRPITVNNNTYTSISAAWRALSPPGLSLVTVRWRLREGWGADWAFVHPVVSPEDRRTFKELRLTFDGLTD
jgi:hypothetical protein